MIIISKKFGLLVKNPQIRGQFPILITQSYENQLRKAKNIDKKIYLNEEHKINNTNSTPPELTNFNHQIRSIFCFVIKDTARRVPTFLKDSPS